MGKIEVINHPLIQHKLSILRRTDTSTKAFRELVDEIAMLMGMKYFVIFHLKTWKLKHLSQRPFKKQLAGKKIGDCPNFACRYRDG